MKQSFSDYHSLQGWEQRKAKLKNAILEKVGMNPDKRPEPVVCTETKSTDMGVYVIKNVYWQTLPNYYTAGNTYWPKNFHNPVPAVMLPHGHFEDDRFNLDSRQLAASLAGLGCLVIIYDMVGKGDDTGTPHDNKYNNAIQLHNSIRILDYICSLDCIDKERIAITGASGGGTQTMMLSAIDSRISISIPVCMTSAHFNGGCKCESGMGYFDGKGYITNTAEIAAMFAPKKLLVISIGTDWTKNTPKIEFPYLQKVFGFYGAEDKVMNAHFETETHNYGPNKRAAAIEFICAEFGLDMNKYNEAGNNIPDIDKLRSYSEIHPKPSGALTNPKKIFEQMLAYYQSTAAVVPVER